MKRKAPVRMAHAYATVSEMAAANVRIALSVKSNPVDGRKKTEERCCGWSAAADESAFSLSSHLLALEKRFEHENSTLQEGMMHGELAYSSGIVNTLDALILVGMGV